MLHDTLKSANILRKAGFAAQQAEAVVAVMTDNLATKEDIENLSLATQRDMKELRRDMNGMETSIRSDMKNGFETLSLATQRDMKELRSDMNGMETSIRSDMEKMGTKLENSFDSRMQKTEYSIRTDMKDMETSIRSDMKDMGTSIRSEVQEISIYTKGQFVLLKWMGGVIGAGVGAIVFRLFFQ